MPPRGQASKRKRTSETEEPEEPRRRSSGRVRESSVVSVRRSTRATTEQLEQSPSASRESPPPSHRQFARRTGAPLPPPEPATPSRARARPPVSAPAPAPTPRSIPKPPPKRMVVELPSPPNRISLSSQNRSRAPRPSQGRSGRQSSVFSLGSDDWQPTGEEDNSGEMESPVATAGPGPRTRAHRALRPVPQPTASMFRQVMPPPPVPSQDQDHIGRFASQLSPESDSPPETQPESLPPARPVTIINGEEAYVIGDSDSGEDESMGRFSCLDKKCRLTFNSKRALGGHLREHADKMDPKEELSDSSTPVAAKRKIAQLERKHVEETERLEDKATKLAAELADVRSQLTESVARSAAALQSSSQNAVELKSKDQAISDLEAKLAERDTTIATLQSKVAAMEEVDAELEALAASQASTDGEAPSPEIQIKLLQKKVKKKVSALRNAESDVEFFRSQYQNASTSALTEVTRANELEAKVKKLEQQLQVGLKQRDLHSQAIAKEAKAAADKYKQQLTLLLAQARRTDDAVRKKAAAYERLNTAQQEHEKELHAARSRADDLSKRNTELRDQVALLRGRITGAFDTIEESDDETDDDVPPVRAPNPYLVPAFAPDNNSSRPSPGLADTTLAEGGIEMFRCKWELKESMCLEIFHTRDELEAHGLGHIEKLALELV